MRTSNGQRTLYRLLSIPVTLLAVLLVIWLKIPNPMMILIIPVVFFTYWEGYLAGGLSGLVAVLYSLVFFSNEDRLFTYNSMNMQKVMTIVLAVLVIVILVGKLKSIALNQQSRMRKNQDNFINIFGNMDVQLLVTDLETDEILFSNQKMNENYDIDFNPVGQPCWKVYHGRSRRCEFCPLGQLQENPEVPVVWEWQSDVTGRWYHNREMVIEWTDGRRVHLQQGVDITEMKNMALALMEAKEEAEQSNKAKSDFLSRMSHEIRTPMNAIIGMTGIAKKSDDIRRIRECLDRVEDASTHLLGVINDILDMSKIEAGKFDLSSTDFLLEQMLQRIVNVNSFRFEQKQQHFSIFVDQDVPGAIITDQQRLAQVVTNLLSNAAKFTPNEGRISLSIHKVDEEEGLVTLRFEVKDEGIGMTPEQQARLFTSFEQADGSITRRFGGTGLGLVISQTIVGLMGGEIHVESALGEGSAFCFTIRARRGFSTHSSHLSPHVDWERVGLLAVDGARDVLDYFAAAAASLGLRSDTAQTAGEALTRMKQNEYQIIFVDWTMPGVGGEGLIREIRGAGGDQAIVAMLSGGKWPEMEREAQALGVVSCVSKPLLPSAIIDAINECFGRKKSPQAESRDAADTAQRDVFLGRRLLLVEDVEINREIIKALLEETGIEIVEAENGRVACEVFQREPDAFDLIFMDIHMPQMDGYEATRIIRSQNVPQAKAVPIIAMTANVFKEDIDRCRETGMNDHIGKPVNAEEMLGKMKRYVPVR